MYSVTLDEIIAQYSLQLINTQVKTEGILVTKPSVNRLALQLTGYFDFFESNGIQILGMVEHSYLSQMEKEKFDLVIDKLLSFRFPCIIYCRELSPNDTIIELANKYKIPILSTDIGTADFIADLTRWLKVQLAPRLTMHGVLVDVYGEGVLIIGESGVGKSETALELIKRGHRLVADDAVIIKRVSRQTLIGTSPDLIRYFIELRGIGIIDISKMFGYESVKLTQTIDLVIKLETWDSNKPYERFGLEENYIEILGNEVVCHTIPIRPGRNLAVICESAAVNHRQKKMGYNAAEELSKQTRKNIERDRKKDS